MAGEVRYSGLTWTLKKIILNKNNLLLLMHISHEVHNILSQYLSFCNTNKVYYIYNIKFKYNESKKQQK